MSVIAREDLKPSASFDWSETISEWHKAMNGEDGTRLLDILNAHPHIVSLNSFGCTALHLAMRKSWYGLVHAILRKFDHLRASSSRAEGVVPPLTHHEYFDIDIFREFLTAKEGETDELSNIHRIWKGSEPKQEGRTRRYASGLDVFGMAVIQGNMAINAILADAVCAIDKLFDDNHPYKKVITAVPTARPSFYTHVEDDSKQRMYRKMLELIMAGCFRTDGQATSPGGRVSSGAIDGERENSLDEESPDYPRYQAEAFLKRYDGPPLLGVTLDAHLRRDWQITSPFLPLEEFILLICSRRGEPNFNSYLENTYLLFGIPLNPELCEYIRRINDTQATAEHYAIRFSQGVFTKYLFSKDQPEILISSHQDSLGRTPYHILSSLGKFEYLQRCREYCVSDRVKGSLWCENCTETFTNQIWDRSMCQFWELPLRNLGTLGASRWYVDVETVSKVNGYWPMDVRGVTTTPFDLAMCSPYRAEQNVSREFIRFLLREEKVEVFNTFHRPLDMTGEEIRGILQLAAYIGDVETVQILAENENIYDIARFNNRSKRYMDKYSALHVAALAGHQEIIRIILSTGNFDISVKDHKGNTALHLAAHSGFFQFRNTLTDFVEIPKTRIGVPYKDATDLTPAERREMARIGEDKKRDCINLLLQEAIDVWEINHNMEIANPGPNASLEYRTWWFDKLSKEALDIKNNFNAAANAISVTAALVATASYVGPLQPPLGYASETEGLKVEILSVRIFIVCNTLAFYLALAAIMISLTQSVPMQQESMLDELRLTRTGVTLALTLLIISIVGVLVAFASASIAVISNQGSWNHGGLTASTLGTGGSICLFVLVLCLFRLVRLVCYKNRNVREFYRRFVPF